jgi:hypothetical protein
MWLPIIAVLFPLLLGLPVICSIIKQDRQRKEWLKQGYIYPPSVGFISYSRNGFTMGDYDYSDVRRYNREVEEYERLYRATNGGKPLQVINPYG